MKEIVSHSISVIPSFHDVDAMQVVWHGNYYRFFERAREALFTAIHYGYPEMKADGYTFPIIRSQCTHRRPMLLGVEYTVKAAIVECDNRLVVSYLITNPEGERCAEAKTEQITLNTETQQTEWMCPVRLRQLLQLV